MLIYIILIFLNRYNFLTICFRNLILHVWNENKKFCLMNIKKNFEFLIFGVIGVEILN